MAFPSNDSIKVDIANKTFKLNGPFDKQKKPVLQQGISSVVIAPTGQVLAGTGVGEIAVLGKDDLQILRKGKVAGSVTSLSMRSDGDIFFAGTALGFTYIVQFGDLSSKKMSSAHTDRVNGIAFA